MPRPNQTAKHQRRRHRIIGNRWRTARPRLELCADNGRRRYRRWATIIKMESPGYRAPSRVAEPSRSVHKSASRASPGPSRCPWSRKPDHTRANGNRGGAALRRRAAELKVLSAKRVFHWGQSRLHPSAVWRCIDEFETSIEVRIDRKPQEKSQSQREASTVTRVR